MECGQMPSGWIRTRSSECIRWSAGGTPSRSRPEYYNGTIPWAVIGDLNDGPVMQTEGRISELGFTNSSAKWVERGSILVALYGSIGKLGIAKIRLTTNQAIAAADVDPLEPLFVFYYLLAQRNRLKRLGRGGTQQNINLKILNDYPLVLAPLVEQRAIVAKIDRLFSQLDKGIEQLQTVKRQLKQYRQAVLKAAFEGKLTAEWRAEQQEAGKLPDADELLEQIKKAREERYRQQLLEWKKALAQWEVAGSRDSRRKKTGKPQDVEKTLPFWSDASATPSAELPTQWRWIRVADIGEIRLGRQRSPKNVSKDYPTSYIRAANITERGLDLSDVLEMEFTPEERETYGLQIGDVILSEASGSPDQVGKPAVWKGELKLCCFQNTVIRVRPHLPMSEYLLWVFRYCYHCGIFAQVASGVGINHLSASRFARLVIPLPPLEEQTEIVNELESRFSVLDELEKAVDHALQQAEALRQSILKKAFEGRLLSEAELAAVRNDPEYEPADKLLERIRAERKRSKQSLRSSRAGSTRRGTRRGSLRRPQQEINETVSEAE